MQHPVGMKIMDTIKYLKEERLDHALGHLDEVRKGGREGGREQGREAEGETGRERERERDAVIQ